MIPAALYVDPRGVYAALGLDCWGIERDARTYAGPAPVVAHPPCARWGRFAHGSPSRPHERIPGDDGGCFAAALAAVRAWGGVLEHPACSRAWAVYGLAVPSGLGWSTACDGHGWVCEVWQGHYGHRTPKPTWLYACARSLPSLRWGRSDATGRVEKLSRRQREATPEPFARVLVDIARGAR